MRVALAVDGTRGDVYPMLALGAHMREAGHEVVLCAPPDFRANVEERGFLFRPMGIDVRAFLTDNARAVAGGALGFAAAGQRYFRATVERQFERLPEATADCDAIFGAGVCFAGSSAAALHGIPYRFVAYCPVLLPSDDHAPFVAPLARSPRWVNRLLWKLAIPLLSRLLGGEINRHRGRLGLPPAGNVYEMLLSSHPLLAADPVLAPLPADCPLPVERVACLHAETGPELPPKLEAFLEAGPPPVYLGFGSMPDPDPAATTEVLLAAVEAAGCRALVSEGWAGLGQAALPESVMSVGSVSHWRLFPRCAAVVHHGGAGTTTTAARAGVPQVVVAHGADQFYWGERVRSRRAADLASELRTQIAALPRPADLLAR